GYHIDVGDVDVTAQRCTDAVQERVAGGEHADLAPGERQHRGDIEGRGPRQRLAAYQVCRELEVARAAEDEFGARDDVARGLTETGHAILADADDGQPAASRCSLCAQFSRHDVDTHTHSRG